MRGLTTIKNLMDKLEGQDIKIQKLMDNSEMIYSRPVVKNAIVFLLITSVQAKRDNKFLEVYQENNYQWTIRISDFFGTDITEYKISRCRKVVAC